MWSIDPDLPVDGSTTMDQRLGRSVALPRLYLWLFAAFAASALLLATIGIYGVTAYVANQAFVASGEFHVIGQRAVPRCCARHTRMDTSD